MDWFKGKSTQNHGFEMILASNIEVSCKFSHHPILGIHLINKVAHLLQLVSSDYHLAQRFHSLPWGKADLHKQMKYGQCRLRLR